jgi:RNA polymerase sigma-32 factor
MSRKVTGNTESGSDPAEAAGTRRRPAGRGANARQSPAEIVQAPRPRGGAIVPSDPFRRYLAEIRKYPRLTREEERELAIRYREKGDTDAARLLATSNLRLVVRVAMDFRRSYLNILDLIQEGNIGLLQAVTKYDPYREVPFSAYAGYWIRACILKYLLDHWSLVRVGTTNVRRKLFYNLKKEQRRLEAQGITPGVKLLASSMGAEEEDVVEVSRALKGRDVSIDQPVKGGSEKDDLYIRDTMPSGGAGPDEQVEREELLGILREKLAAFSVELNERDRHILDKRLLAEEPATLQAIGDHFGTTREAARQNEARLIKRLKKYLKTEIKDLAVFDVQED